MVSSLGKVAVTLKGFAFCDLDESKLRHSTRAIGLETAACRRGYALFANSCSCTHQRPTSFLSQEIFDEERFR